MEDKDFIENYTPIFELGITVSNPAVKVLGDYSVCPVLLAALVTTLFEAVMKNVEDSKQISYEKDFNKALKVLMKERYHYDVTYKQLFIEDEDQDV